MNEKPEIISVCSTLYVCNKIPVKKPLVDISHVQLFSFLLKVYNKQNINLTEVFHVNPPPGFSFLPHVRFEIIHCRLF